MNETILIADLTHTGSKSYSPNLIPYPIGCIKSHLLEYSTHSSDLSVEIFKDPQNLQLLALVIMFGILSCQQTWQKKSSQLIQKH